MCDYVTDSRFDYLPTTVLLIQVNNHALSLGFVALLFGIYHSPLLLMPAIYLIRHVSVLCLQCVVVVKVIAGLQGNLLQLLTYRILLRTHSLGISVAQTSLSSRFDVCALLQVNNRFLHTQVPEFLWILLFERNQNCVLRMLLKIWW